MKQLLIVAILTTVIHMVNTLIYSVRLSGVRTERLATALSLFQVIFLIASTANLIQAPLMSSIVEHAINNGIARVGANELLGSSFYQHQLGLLNTKIRLVILAGTIGTILGGLLIPAFVSVFVKWIMLLEGIGSVPRMLLEAILRPRKISSMTSRFRLPSPGRFRDALREPLNIPRHFLIANIIITGIWTTGVLSALYAGALIPHFRSTATLMSGIINGVAAVLAATVVDPTAALITDQAMRGVRKETDVRQMAIYLAFTRLLGTMLAQVIFVPAALIIRAAVVIIT
ncbi:MAG: hypothetical protein XD78_0425 [Desulfotomaculum sp. 46_296]|nr:MAG: hypothetical protein XD78_0425 [Desulfotomaculum sp. 46_296]HAU32485.1 DUF2837 domain-containing protein [Desulfotomaculum sp.]